MIMQNKFFELPTRANKISQAMRRRAIGGNITLKTVVTVSNNPKQLSVVEQLQRMRWAVAEIAKKLGPNVSCEEYETVLNEFLPRIGVNMRATVVMDDDES